MFRFQNDKIYEICKNNLIDAIDIFQSSRKRYWLNDGTLLGYYREGDILRHDKDFDFGLMVEDIDMELIDAFLKQRFQIYWLWGNYQSNLQISFIRNNIPFDIFIYYTDKENNEMYHYTHFRVGGLFCYKYKMFNTKQVTWFGHDVMIPEDPEEFLIQKYGMLWSIPIKNWDSRFHPYNLDWKRCGFKDKQSFIERKINILKGLVRAPQYGFDVFRTGSVAYQQLQQTIPKKVEHALVK